VPTGKTAEDMAARIQEPSARKKEKRKKCAWRRGKKEAYRRKGCGNLRVGKCRKSLVIGVLAAGERDKVVGSGKSGNVYARKRCQDQRKGA